MRGGRVIQGFFIGGRPRAATLAARAPLQRAVPGATHAPGPPAPAFTTTRTAQRHGGNGSFEIDPVQIGLASGGGSPLPKSVLAKMEAAFGVDFSSVRVHVGPQASRIGAVAFTMGDNVYFAPGQFQPDTVKGQQLLGHELAHVVQQRQGRVRAPGSGVAVVQDRMLEAEADRLGMQAAAHRAPLQAKMAGPGRETPVHISAPQGTGPGSYRLTAGSGGNPMGSLVVHTRRGAAAEITDLGVDARFRDQGIGRQLLVSAARAGLRSGNSKLALAAQDNGSGRLTRWYKELGFQQVGVNGRGFPMLEAPIGRLLAGTVQRKLDPATLARPHVPGSVRHGTLQRAAKPKQKAAKVVLTIGATPYTGSSSGQYGHAEMEALRKFIVAQPSTAAAVIAINAAAVKTVQCHNQPVCGSCNRVLTALGFVAADADTELSNSKSGGVSWGANLKVKELMEAMGFTATYDQAIKDGAK